MADNDDTLLPHITCPITGAIFCDPVTLNEDGQTYERQALMSWLSTKKTSPFNKTSVNIETVKKQKTSYAMKNIVEQYLVKYPEKQNEVFVLRHTFNCDQFKLIVCLEKQKEYIDKCEDLECEDNEKWRPIHFLCRYFSNSELIKYVIDKGVNLECETYDKWRPIHILCRYSTDSELIKYVINKGVNLECKTIDQWRPIHFLCRNSTDSELIKYMINKGVNLECETDKKWRPIHILCRNFTNLELIKYVIDKGVDLECEDDDKWRPIHVLC